jgi:hypothetical protein
VDLSSSSLDLYLKTNPIVSSDHNSTLSSTPKGPYFSTLAYKTTSLWFALYETTNKFSTSHWPLKPREVNKVHVVDYVRSFLTWVESIEAKNKRLFKKW